jgi:hypothetical protein
MPRADREPPVVKRADWRLAVLLAWMVGVGVVYARMVLDHKAPGWADRLGRVIASVPGGP